MHLRALSLPAWLVCLALLTPAAAHATADVVTNPASGVSAVRISDEDQANAVTVRVAPSSPIADGHFSAVFFDLNGDGKSDRAIVATRSSGTTTVRALSTTQSTTSCQQVGGTGSTAIGGATTTVAIDGGSYTVTVPASALPGTVRWKAVGTPQDTSCSGTDGAVQAVVLSLGDARTFTGSGGASPDTTPPAAPAGLVATAGNASATLDWADNTEGDLAGYLVYRRVQGGAFSLIAEPTSSKLSDTGLLNGTTYEYYVRAKDATGNLSSNSATVTVTPVAPGGGGAGGGNGDGGGNDGGSHPKVPSRPGRPKALEVTSKLVKLDWPSRKGCVKYRIFRRLGGHHWPKRPLATVRVSAFTDHHVKPGRTYEYRIVGVTAAGKATKPSKTIKVKTKHGHKSRRS